MENPSNLISNSEILRAYDREKRAATQIPGMRRESLPNLVRHVDLLGHRGMITWSHLNAATAEQVIRQQVEFYSGLNQPFEWKVFDTDQPVNLKERLRAFGFTEEPEESLMVLPIGNGEHHVKLSAKHEVRCGNDVSLLPDLLRVQETAYGESAGWLGDSIAHTLRAAPETLTLYVAYHKDRPVASARIDFEPGSQFAGLWGGVVLPEFRGQGFYLSLLAARIEEAAARCCKFVTIDAGPMSRPIVERRGFRQIATAQAFLHGPYSSEKVRPQRGL